MRILLVTGLTHFGRSGVHREAERLIAGLRGRGVDVGFVVDRAIPSLEGDVSYFRIPYPPPADVDQRLVEAILAYQPDVMHIIGGGVRLLWAGHRAASRAGVRLGRAVPWLVTIHNVPPREGTAPWFQGCNALYYPLRNLLRAPSGRVWRRFLRRAQFSRAVCHSPAIAEVACRAGCPEHKLVDIPLGCEPLDVVGDEAVSGEAENEAVVGASTSAAASAPSGAVAAVSAVPVDSGDDLDMPLGRASVGPAPSVERAPSVPSAQVVPSSQPPAADSADPPGLEPFAPDDSPRLVSVGGLAHHKGFHDYLRVVARLVPDYPRLRYVIMGDMRDRRYHRTLKRLIHRLGLGAHVQLLVSASEAHRLAAVRGADLYVVPSHEEGFCLSFLEGAMLSARTLGTRCGAIAQMTAHDPTQQLVTPRDLVGLERATRELLAVEPSDAALERRRRMLRDRFDWRRHIDAHLALYQSLAS